ncbi:hypothetical protein Bhyg_01055 [Pseudolycoriella hygida]|uniref:Uncharacterized protein n=1 Tax=Pseudolycoriella hygida TaxID=35572 RepID=A0A9Q0NA51_9DIPT|nr:hypothetical protein Bhyg_01055 [Pseudolycoriella hygida]
MTVHSLPSVILNNQLDQKKIFYGDIEEPLRLDLGRIGIGYAKTLPTILTEKSYAIIVNSAFKYPGTL